MAASYYGIPRTTLDADFIIHIPSKHTARFLRGLENADVKVDLRKALRQLKAGYNVITVGDKLSPHTADLILVESSPDRKKGTVLGAETFFQSPESLILAKLRMIKATLPVERSFKDREDIRQILSNTKVNRRKLLGLAEEQNTATVLRELLKPSRHSRSESPE